MDSTGTNKPFVRSLLVLGKSLGSGAFGTVHEARWGNQPCAAKSCLFSQSDFHHDAIQKEISLLQTLRHRHVIQFYRTHEEDGCIYLLMELAEKGSLSRAISKGELAPDDWVTKKRLASEIARGLAFIHQENVFHRDLKSANVLLTRHMEVKLADFGLAKVQSMASAASVADASGVGLKGTLRWIAPELLFGDSRVYSTKSDMYALGVVMWEMAANCTRPFKEQENDALVALDVRNGCREQLPEGTPIKYRRLVEQCWDQDPDQRPEAGEVALLYDEPVSESSGIAEGSTIDVSLFDSDWDHNASTVCDDRGMSTKVTHDDSEQHVGQIPSTDDDVVAHLSMSAKRGSVDAQLFLGWIYGHGRGVGKSEKDSFWWYQQAAYQGPVVAQVQVGKMYEQGVGIDASDEKAASWYRRAANSGSAEAQYRLGWMYGDGRGVGQDDMEALKLYHMAAEAGQCDAQATLGQWYSLGRGVKQSDVEAVKWLQQAAEQGDATAQFYLGMMYHDGQGVELSYAEGVKWYIKSAEQGNGSASFHLEEMCQPWRGDEQSHVAIAKWYTKLAEQGSAAAQLKLGVIYERGLGVERSDSEAVKWYTKAAEQGDAEAQQHVGLKYLQGQGVEQSDVEAVKWFAQVDGDEAKAQKRIAWLYSGGGKVKQSHVEAFKWLSKAAELGDAEAQYSLGWMYEVGQGVDQSDHFAVFWYSRSAEQENRYAQFNLASMYELGLGVRPDIEEALRWFRKAAAKGEHNSNFHIQWLTSTVYHGIQADGSPHDAVAVCRQGADQGYVAAQHNLGRMYEKGLGVTRDPREAMEWYGKANAHGHTDSYSRLTTLSSRGDNPYRL